MSEHFHGLTPAQHERLSMLGEEASEIGVAIGKIMRHGLYSFNPDAPEKGTNIYQLQAEIADLLGVISGMSEAGDNVSIPSADAQRIAWDKKLRYSHHQGSSTERFVRAALANKGDPS